MGAGLLASFFGGRTLSPSPCLGQLGRSLSCTRRPPSVVGLGVVAPAPSVVHRNSATHPGFLPPSEVLHLVGVFPSAVAVPCCVVLVAHPLWLALVLWRLHPLWCTGTPRRSLWRLHPLWCTGTPRRSSVCPHPLRCFVLLEYFSQLLQCLVMLYFFCCLFRRRKL